MTPAPKPPEGDPDLWLRYAHEDLEVARRLLRDDIQPNCYDRSSLIWKQGLRRHTGERCRHQVPADLCRPGVDREFAFFA